MKQEEALSLSRLDYMQKCNFEELSCFICGELMSGTCGECKFMKSVDGKHTCGLRDWLKEEHKDD